MKPRSTEAGPPLWNAFPEPMNRPAPIAPPLRAHVSIYKAFSALSLHGNHLHVSALQVAMQLVLVRMDDANILRINTELPPPYMLAERCRLWRRWMTALLKNINLLRETHLRNETTIDDKDDEECGAGRRGQLEGSTMYYYGG